MSSIDPGILQALATAQSPSVMPPLSEDPTAEASRHMSIHSPMEGSQHPGATGTHPQGGRGTQFGQALAGTLDRSNTQDDDTPDLQEQKLNLAGKWDQGFKPGESTDVVKGTGEGASVTNYSAETPQGKVTQGGGGGVPAGIDPAIWQQLTPAQQAQHQAQQSGRSEMEQRQQQLNTQKQTASKVSNLLREQKGVFQQMKVLQNNPLPTDEESGRLKDLQQKYDQYDEQIRGAQDEHEKSFGTEGSAAPSAQPQRDRFSPSLRPEAMMTPAKSMMDRLAMHGRSEAIGPQTAFQHGKLYKSPTGKVHQVIGTWPDGSPAFSEALA